MKYRRASKTISTFLQTAGTLRYENHGPDCSQCIPTALSFYFMILIRPKLFSDSKFKKSWIWIALDFKIGITFIQKDISITVEPASLLLRLTMIA